MKYKLKIITLFIILAICLNINIVFGIGSSYQPHPHSLESWNIWFRLEDKPDIEVYFIGARIFSGGNRARIENYSNETGDFIIYIYTYNSDGDEVYDYRPVSGIDYLYDKSTYNYEYIVINRTVSGLTGNHPYIKISRMLKNSDPTITLNQPTSNSSLNSRQTILKGVV